jgi:hypothetical protein
MFKVTIQYKSPSGRISISVTKEAPTTLDAYNLAIEELARRVEAYNKNPDNVSL